MIVGIFALLLTAILVGLLSMKKLAHNLHEINAYINPIHQSIFQVTELQLTQGLWFERALRARQNFTTIENVTIYTEALNQYTLLNESIREAIEHADKQSQEGSQSAKNEEVSKEFSKIQSQLAQLKTQHQAYEEAVLNAFELIATDVEIGPVIQEVTELNNRLNERVKAMSQEIAGFAGQILTTAEMTESKAERWMLLTSLAGVILGLLFSILIIRNIFAQIGGEPVVIASLAEEVALGNLAQDTSHYQETTGIHHSTLKMALNLGSVIGNVNENAHEVSLKAEELRQDAQGVKHKSEEVLSRTTRIAGATEEITINSGRVADESEQVSSKIDNVSSSIEELSANITTIAAATEEASANMSSVSQNIQHISEETGKVKDSVDEMGAIMYGINAQSEHALKISAQADKSATESLEIMNDLAETANKIGRIVKLISNIASQTNMLSLNATIEATNAGAAGKGFAVVAQEVKQLAHESAAANNEVAEQIQLVQDKIGNALGHTQDVSKVIHSVIDVFEGIAESIADQNETAQQIAQALESITQASQTSVANVAEATEGVKEITRNITQASLASKESARNVQEGSMSVKEIARSSKELLEGITEINQSLQTIQTNSEELSQDSSKSSETAAKLEETAEALQKLVGYFKLR